MNNDMFKGKWHEMKGKIKEKWGKLTDDDLTQANGQREQFLGKLQSRYGWEKQRAEDELKRFEDSCGGCSNCNCKNKNSRDRKGDNNDNYKGKDNRDDYPKRKAG